MRQDVHRLLEELDREISLLGPEGSQPSRVRMFLTRVSTEFQSIV